MTNETIVCQQSDKQVWELKARIDELSYLEELRMRIGNATGDWSLDEYVDRRERDLKAELENKL